MPYTNDQRLDSIESMSHEDYFIYILMQMLSLTQSQYGMMQGSNCVV